MRRFAWIGVALLVSAILPGSNAVAAGAPAKVLKKVLLVTGQDYPGHKWQETAPVLAKDLRVDSRLAVTVTEDPKTLASPDIDQYDAIVLHFMNWEQPDPGPEARANLKRFVEGGKGLVIVHFACGAFQEWPEFRNLAGRSYDPKLRPHDPFGKFRVEITPLDHPVSKGMKPFETTDELYTCLAGDRPIEVLATARSSVDQKDYPMAFTVAYGAGRVFHSPLGHDAASLANPPVADLFRRGCAWAAGLDPDARPKRIALIAGKPSHGEGLHEHEKGVELLKRCLETSPNIGPVEISMAFNGWPEDAGVLDNADTIFLYSDGYEGNPFFAAPERQEKIQSLIDRGVGLVCLHFAVSPPRNEAAEAVFAQWLGGYYKDGVSQNPVLESQVALAAPDHPISRGLTPYTLTEEFYFKLLFANAGATPILSATGTKEGPQHDTIAWAFERPNGGRSFGFTGGHFHTSWNNESYRKMILNALLWTAHMDVPAGGVQSSLDNK